MPADVAPLGVPLSGTYRVSGKVLLWVDAAGVRLGVSVDAPTTTGVPWGGRGVIPWDAGKGAILHAPGTVVITRLPSLLGVL